jgi:16S rRNA processing protein RimM
VQDAGHKPQHDPDEGFVAVGRVQGPFGLKGELKVLSLTDNPDRFRPKARLWAGKQPVTVAAVREAQGYVYLTLKGFHDRTSVEKFRHALLQVPESELPELEEGHYYRFQLLGLTVLDRAGAELGVVAEVIETGATDVYRVRTPEGTDLLLPATDDVVLSVDLAAKRMVVDPPPWT